MSYYAAAWERDGLQSRSYGGLISFLGTGCEQRWPQARCERFHVSWRALAEGGGCAQKTRRAWRAGGSNAGTGVVSAMSASMDALIGVGSVYVVYGNEDGGEEMERLLVIA